MKARYTLRELKNIYKILLIFSITVATFVAMLPTPGQVVAQGPVAVISQRTTADMMAEQARRGSELAARVRPIRAEDGAGLVSGRVQNPESPAVASYVDPNSATKIASDPFAARGGGPFAPQAVSTTFIGPNEVDSGFTYPPDTNGDVGPTQYFISLNGRFRVYDKTGVAGPLDVHPDVFWSTVMTPIGGGINCVFTFRPHVRFDRFTERWILTMIDSPYVDLVPGDSNPCDTSAENRLLVAISDDPTITASTVWKLFGIDVQNVNPVGDTDLFANHPSLGVDVNALYIGFNMFSSSGFANTTAIVIQKASLLTATTVDELVINAFRDLLDASSNGLYTPQGVDNDDPSAATGYLIGVDRALYGRLVVRRVNNPGSASPTLSSNFNITVPTTTFPCNVPHQGGTLLLDALDDRLTAAQVQNGTIWTAHNINVDTSGVALPDCTTPRTSTRWYQIGDIDGTPNLLQSGTVFDATASDPANYWIPTIGVNGQGHAALGFSVSGANTLVGAATVGRLAGDTPGAMQGTPVTYQAGQTTYDPPNSRWGDYSYTSPDPCDNQTLWTIQEFVQNVSGTGRWAVSVAKLLAPGPADLPGGSLASVNNGQPSVIVTLDGSDADGRGFFDPGAGYNCRLSASVSNGVVVNSVTYNSPTSITLNLNTTSATPGLATVTIINPDGQTETGQLTINAVLSTPISPSGLWNTSLTPTYTYSSVPGATAYALVSYNLSTSAQVLFNTYAPNCSGGVCTTVHDGAALTNNTTYSWYVAWFNGTFWSPWNDGALYVLSVPPATAPNAIAPDGVYLDTDAFATYTWSALADAVAYYIVIYDLTTSTFQFDEFYVGLACPGGTCAVTPNAAEHQLVNGRTYGWFIAACNYGGCSPFNAGRAWIHFFPPATPTPLSTTFGPPGSSTRPNYTWNGVPGAVFYNVAVVNSTSGAVVLQQYVDASGICAGATCTFTQPTDLPNGSYGWFVLAWNFAGQSPYSGAMGFTIPGVPPPAPTFKP